MRKTVFTAWMELLVYNRQIATGPAAVVMPGKVDIPLVQNQIEFLRSRVVLGKVIDAMDLTNDPEFFSRSNSLLKWLKDLISPPPSKVVNDRTFAFVETLAALRKNIDVTRVSASHIVRMDVRSTDPRKAVQIANEIANFYLQERRSRGIGGDSPAIRELYQGLGPSAYVVSDVQPPIRPSGLPNFVIVLGAVLFGIGGGAFAAVLRDVLSSKIRNPEQLEYFLGLPCLGVVPSVSSTQSGRIPALVGALGNAAAFLRDERRVRSLGITSVLPGDGVTTVALNLARSISRSGKNALLIDCLSADPLPVSLEHDISISAPTCEGADEFDRCSTQVHALDSLIRHASDLYDLVIVDLPSLAQSADARVAARSLDGLLLVVHWDKADCGLASQALDSSIEARAKFVGTILNMADARTARLYSERPRFDSQGASSLGKGTRPRDEISDSGRLVEHI
jgi:Mrp family chromosome partitioning ATPase